MADENESGVASGAIAIIDQAAPENWRRKLGRIAFQLIAGSDGGLEVYAKARERIDEVEAKSTVSKMIAEAVGRNALSDPAVMDRAKARYLAGALRGQENVEAVFQAALPHIPMSDTSEELDSAEGLDQDWADAFAKQAEIASSSELRERLGKVLAGEIKRKGTYPRSVVRVIAELEQPELQAMRQVGTNIMENLLYVDPTGAEKLDMNSLLTLSAEGLISDSGAGLTATKTIRDDGTTYYLGNPFSLWVKGNPGVKLNFDVLSLSKTGRAVAELLGPFDNRAFLEQISERLKGQVYETAITKVTVVGGDIFEKDRELLYRSPDAPS